MSDLRLNSLTYELDIENGDLILTTGADAVEQHLRQRLWFFLGEWFLATDQGVPYFQSILGQKLNLGSVSAILQETILTTPGVIELLSFELDFDNATRELSLDFAVRTSDGDIDFSSFSLGGP